MRNGSGSCNDYLRPGIRRTPHKRARDGRPQRLLLGQMRQSIQSSNPTFRRLAPLHRIVHHVMLKRAFNVLKKGVGKIVFAKRADVLLGENEPLLRAVVVEDVPVNVALGSVCSHTIHCGTLQPPPMPHRSTAIRIELKDNHSIKILTNSTPISAMVRYVIRSDKANASRYVKVLTVAREETFGPVSPIIRFKDINDAIRISNGTAYGLSSSVCTNRLDYITRFVNDLHVGSVNIREVPGYRLELTPFGGIKDSGLGYKEGVQEAIKSFTNIKTYSLPWV